MMDKFLVIGACGQVGTELVENLQSIHGNSQVVASDIRTPNSEVFSNSEFVALECIGQSTDKGSFSNT
jgi:nucleoside-diphosphate-sugar epimerase